MSTFLKTFHKSVIAAEQRVDLQIALKKHIEHFEKLTRHLDDESFQIKLYQPINLLYELTVKDDNGLGDYKVFARKLSVPCESKEVSQIFAKETLESLKRINTQLLAMIDKDVEKLRSELQQVTEISENVH